MIPSAPPRAPAPAGLRVLVVDDSAVARQMFRQLLQGGTGFQVATASDGVLALAAVEQSPPDVVLLDLEMPRLDGLAFLRRLMATRPLPVVVCSSHTARGTEKALRALEAGAVEVLGKEALRFRDAPGEAAERLVRAVRAASLARPAVRRAPSPAPAPVGAGRPVAPVRPAPAAANAAPWTRGVVALGASTGGTEALREILRQLPADAPPVVVVQHMPPRFTTALARSLDLDCAVHVAEAAGGEELRPGLALIAPGNRHLRVRRRGGRLVAELDDGAEVSRHRPSVDVLFHSVAEAAGVDAVGVLLTGMGDDGADGLLALRRAGARTLVQDEATCVVFGMPREAIRRGAAEAVLPLPRIAGAILARARAAAS